VKATTYLLLILGAGAVFAQASLEVIELRHTTAEQVLPALRPLLEPGGVLTGQRSQLIVRTSPRNLEELRRALQALDAPVRRLEISVRFDAAGEAGQSEAALDARISNRGSRAEVRAGESRSLSGERVDQRVQVLEGGRAYIATGTSFPIRHADGVQIREAASGFEVIPRLAGGMVILEIAPQRQSTGAIPGSVDSMAAATSVRARLGEWVEIAGIEESSTRRDRGLGAGAQRRDAASRRIWVRVDEVRP
jgi:hypothetical protein